MARVGRRVAGAELASYIPAPSAGSRFASPIGVFIICLGLFGIAVMSAVKHSRGGGTGSGGE